MSVITVEELNTYSPDEAVDPARGQLVVDAVNEYVTSTTGRSYGELTTVTETHDMAHVIFLRHMDVAEVTEVKRGRGVGNTTTLLAASYFVSPTGRLVLDQARNGFYTNRDYITVTYKYGTDFVPADLKLAALSIAADFYNFASEGNTTITESAVGSYKEKIASGETASTGAQHFGIINRYRTRNL